MTHHPTGLLANDAYYTGILQRDPVVLEAVFQEFRQPLLRAVSQAGGNQADGSVFFQAALTEAYGLLRAGRGPENHTPFFFWLKDLVLAHYRDWLIARGGAPESEEMLPETAFQEPGALAHTRRRLLAWRRLLMVDGNCRNQLLSERGEGKKTTQDCEARFLEIVASRPSLEFTGLSAAEISADALSDKDGFRFFETIHGLEKKAAGNPEDAGPGRPSSGNRWGYLMLAFLVAILGFSVYRFMSRSKSAAEVYREHFDPPASLMADRDNRYAAGDSSNAEAATCREWFRQTDDLYQKGQLDDAREALLYILADTNLTECHSDAWFFMGIVQLKGDAPDGALECFSKIEDAQLYGEDIYWYQALAFVKIAEQNPDMRPVARRAVERMQGNLHTPDRKQQAATMLKHLSD